MAQDINNCNQILVLDFRPQPVQSDKRKGQYKKDRGKKHPETIIVDRAA